MPIEREPVGPGQESVWDYPRPAVAELSSRHVRIVHRGVVVAETRRAVRTLETSHPPSWYVPRADVADGVLRETARRSVCEWKGVARYFDVVVGDAALADVGWSYARPSDEFEALAGHVAFYAGPFDECTVDGVRVVPQAGGFYGGWITPELVGPFKGGPGTMGW